MKNLVFALLVVVLSSCQFMDDQTIISADRIEVGNPTPVTRDFKAINDQHKVLVAIIDSGIDYNQPYLIDNLHFKLDANANPIGFGYDISGQDEWASPYVVRTSDYNRDMEPTENRKSIEQVQAINSLLAIAPDLSPILDPRRNISQEVMGSAFHGTHVAGLASYDAPEIGLLSYRVLPFSLKFVNGTPVQEDISQLFIDQLLEASERAIGDGARVINMSLAQIIEKKYSPGQIIDSETKAHLQRAEKLRELALAYPGVAFVVAAGNDGKWIDQNTRTSLPCGADAPNIVCVGAVDSQGDIANFSNILLSKGTFVLGYGVNVKSTMPQEMCIAEAMNQLQEGDKILAMSAAEKTTLANKLRKDCSDRLLQELSGTSMASPIIARKLALILSENPHMTAEMAIQKMIGDSDSYNLGKIAFPRMKIKKPSWSKQNTNASTMGIRSGAKDSVQECNRKKDDYFEFVIPQSYSR